MQRATDLRVAGGVAGMAEASATPAAAAGAGMGASRSWFDPSNASFWVGVFTAGSIAWLLWIRFIYRGAAI